MQHTGQVPSNEDPAVFYFLTIWDLVESPIQLQYADHGYDAAQCHVSAKHKALSGEGRRVHGWALWIFGNLLLADHHSVWEDENGNLVDVTPPSNGGLEILFVRDDNARIEMDSGAILLFTQRTADATNRWFWQGKSSDYSNWPCPLDKADLVSYCAKLSIPVLDILTDDKKG
jgi:hypothetical protein